MSVKHPAYRRESGSQSPPNGQSRDEAIADDIARDNPQRAVTFVREIRDKCLGLAEMPLAFPLVPRFERHGVRHRVYGNDQIFYRVVGGPPTRIDILHVLHGARDCASILF